MIQTSTGTKVRRKNHTDSISASEPNLFRTVRHVQSRGEVIKLSWNFEMQHPIKKNMFESCFCCSFWELKLKNGAKIQQYRDHLFEPIKCNFEIKYLWKKNILKNWFCFDFWQELKQVYKTLVAILNGSKIWFKTLFIQK